tara:strand:+ start:37197 stop:38390 length:1194 start_codon:yes stop_codon:yes gene_type:complete
MEPAPETLAGISVDAVREQLKQLGHDCVSDEVIREFLIQLAAEQLTADAAFIETPAVAVPSQEIQANSRRPRRAARTTASAAKARAAADGTSNAPSAPTDPETARVPTSPKVLQSKEKKQTPAVTPTPTTGRSITARGADGSLMETETAPQTPSTTSSVRARRTTPGSASTSKSSKMQTPRLSSARRVLATPSSVKTTFGTASRFKDLSPAPETRPGSAQHTRTRKVAQSVDAHNRFVEAKLASVIRAPRETRGTKPGQFRVVDRVARAAQFQDAWKKDSFLINASTRTEVRQQQAVVPRKLENFAQQFQKAQARSEANVAKAKKANRENGKKSREYWEQHFEISRRAQVKLTDTGGSRGQNKSKATVSGKFQTPQDSRRDDVRWEMRIRMAAPPVM